MLEEALTRLLFICTGGLLLGAMLGDTLTWGTYTEDQAWPAPANPGAIGFVAVKLAVLALGLWMIYRGARPKTRWR